MKEIICGKMPKKEKEHLKCPYCEKDLQKKKESRDMSSILITKYDCNHCKAKFERHTIFSSLNLVNSDVLYAEFFKDSWSG